MKQTKQKQYYCGECGEDASHGEHICSKQNWEKSFDKKFYGDLRLKDGWKELVEEEKENAVKQAFGKLELEMELHRHNSIPSFMDNLDEGCSICEKNKAIEDIKAQIKLITK